MLVVLENQLGLAVAESARSDEGLHAIRYHRLLRTKHNHTHDTQKRQETASLSVSYKHPDAQDTHVHKPRTIVRPINAARSGKHKKR